MNAPLSVEQLLPQLDHTHLDWLEEEAIFILRETVAAFERPALLFSGGKDSCVVLHLAQKAFKLAGHSGTRLPFPLLHVDTGHNFPEVLAFRDAHVAALGERLIVAHLEDSIARGSVRLGSPGESRNGHQSVTLMEATLEYRFDVLIGGARRDEEKARAKERILSHRDAFGQWQPKNQRLRQQKPRPRPEHLQFNWQHRLQKRKPRRRLRNSKANTRPNLTGTKPLSAKLTWEPGVRFTGFGWRI